METKKEAESSIMKRIIKVWNTLHAYEQEYGTFVVENAVKLWGSHKTEND